MVVDIERPLRTACCPILLSGTTLDALQILIGVDRRSIALGAPERFAKTFEYGVFSLMYFKTGTQGVVGGANSRRLIDADLVPDLLLADYHLGNARTGLDALAEISVEFSGPLPAIVVSSDTSPQLTAELQQRGIPFLTKPVEVARLRALMQHLLRGW